MGNGAYGASVAGPGFRGNEERSTSGFLIRSVSRYMAPARRYDVGVTNLFSDEMRRNPYPLYAQMREKSPLFYVPPPFDAWMIFDYQTVKWAMNDHTVFSSRVPAPDWFIFSDPPGHTKLRGLISQAFTPRMVANLEPRIRELSRELLNKTAERGEMDLAADYSIPLPMMV